MKRVLMAALLGLFPSFAEAHFQELIPSTDILPGQGEANLRLDLRFTHPMERGPLMDMAAPQQFGVLAAGKKTDLRPQLQKASEGGKTIFTASYRPALPGDYVFYVAPAPYWEAAEGKYIQHFAKVVVDFASGGGWDKLVGLPVEIEPLVRPYGLWTGNLFRGIIRQNGKPLPFAEIEVEWRNDGTVTAPSDPFITQVIKADAGGQFSYAMPRAGWWGFAALVDGKPMAAPNGKMVPVEQGGVMWVKVVDMK